MKCTFCGYEFDIKNSRKGCSGCFFSKKGKDCGWIKCPSCGFELVPQENPVETAPEKPQTEETDYSAVDSLAQLGVGDKAEVTRLDTQDRLVLRKLIAMGILPQTRIKLVQKFPAYVFEAGYDCFTIDKELARCIFVKKIA